jgi:hydroxyethylthiazole kinase-like uncharacterized protein yjeF
MKLVTVDQMRQIERHAHETLGWRYDDMMEMAGQQLALLVQHKVSHLTTRPKITFLIGKGNNGGDALIASRLLAPDYDVRCYLLDFITDLKQVDETNAFILSTEKDPDGQMLKEWIKTTDIVVDGIFGIGVHLPLRKQYADVLHTVNQIIRKSKNQPVHETALIFPHQTVHSAPAIQVIAVDCPSGIDCNTGQADPNTLPADVTITFIAPKIGQVLSPALSYVGELVIATLGIPAEPIHNQLELATLPNMKALLPHRPLDANKGTFGKSLIIGGCANYYGAPTLSAMACYRSGTGIVTVGTIPSAIHAIASQHPEPTYIPLTALNSDCIDVDSYAIVAEVASNYDSLLIGVGMGTTDRTEGFLINLLKHDLPPLILDADALNILSTMSDWWEYVSHDSILTPHPGEMSRLTGLTIPQIQADRIEIARQSSAKWGATVLLKGAHTVIASPDGQITILPFKSSTLATAGTGDLLAGLIAGFRAQGLSSHNASVLGGYVHGLAGKIAEDQFGNGRGVIASDILQAIPEALTWIENS